MIASLVVFGRD